MEQKQLQQIFEKYLDGQATKDEVRLLLQHFATDDEQQLKQLIVDSFENSRERESTDLENEITGRVRSNLIQITGGNEKKKKTAIISSIWFKLAIAGLAILICFLIFFIPKIRLEQLAKVSNRTVQTHKGQRKTITLSDGTRIWLAPASTLIYPERFSDTTRNVQLSGEAFFVVAKDKEHPFVVQAGKLITRVLGTTFNIHAYKNEDSRITLLTGKVALSVTGRKKTGTYLIPNQQADLFNNTDSIMRSAAPNAGWMLDRKEGIFHYRGTSVIGVIADIERSYNIQVNLQSDLGGCTFYGDFKTTEDPILLLRKVCVVINAQFKYDENGITIIGKGCTNP